MNADERTPGQQGYGQQSPQQSDGQQPSSQQQQVPGQNPEGGPSSTGQASYGNSGQADTLSQNSSFEGQESDFGQAGGQGSESTLFKGSQDDTGGGASGQQFADQGQGAMNEDLMGADGTTDIEVERSQGRENDIEGSSL